MIKNAKLKYIEADSAAPMDLVALRENFDKLEEVANNHAEELKLLAQMHTQTISYAIDVAGLTTILKPNKHKGVRIVNAFVQMGDNIKEEQFVGLTGISDNIKFSKSERSGKVRMFTLTKDRVATNEPIRVSTSSNRRIIVNVTIEGDN